MFTLDDVRATYKWRDAWWTVFLVDPLASRLVLPIANRTNITPNQVSFASLVVGLLAAAAFTQGHHPALLLGALLYHLSFVLDCVDGKVARLKGTGSVFGMWLDYSFDRYRVLACTMGLMYGQYQRTGEVGFIWLAVVVTFLDMLRYMDALQVYKLRREMGRRLRAAARAARHAGATYVVEGPGVVRYLHHGGARDGGFYPVPAATDGEDVTYVLGHGPGSSRRGGPLSRLPWWGSVRDLLIRHRVRPHLFSGIEYQMFIFVVGPALDAVVPLVVFSAAMLLAFELAVIVLLLLSSKDFQRELARFTPGSTAALAATATATAAGAPDVAHVPAVSAAHDPDDPDEPDGP